MTTALTIPVMMNSSLKAWPKHEAGGVARYLSLSKALTSKYQTDAHCAAYSVPAIERRLSRDAVANIDGGVPMTLVVFDIDGAEHKGSDEWFAAERGAILDLIEASEQGAPFVYRTRGGYRIVYRLAQPIYIQDASDAAGWTALYGAWVANLRRRFGIQADPSCKDWQRLFRLPHATRDEGGQPEDREVIGNASAIGTWHCELTDEDMAKAPKKRKAATARTVERNPGRTGRGRLVDAFDGRGMLDREIETGMWAVECPWESNHTGGTTFDSSTVVFGSDAAYGDLGFFHCSHAHCIDRPQPDVIALFSDEEMGNPPKCGATTKHGKTCPVTELHTDGKCVIHSSTPEAKQARREHVKTTSANTVEIEDPPRCEDKPETNSAADKRGKSSPIVLLTAADIIRGAAFSRPRRKFATGIPELDAATQGGLRSRQQSVIAAPTGVGKTGLVGTIMLGMSAHHPVLWVCTELDSEEQSARFAALKMRESDRGRYTPDDLLSHALPPGETAAFVDGKPLYILRLRRIDRDGHIIDPFALIITYVNAIASEHGEPPIIVVDYLQKLAAEDEERRRISVGNVSERLLSIAQDFDTHLMAISSVSRAFYNATARKLRKMATEEDPRDWMACGKEAGEIEYDAALMMFLDVGDDADAVAQHRARLIVAKARGGGVGFYGMRFHGPSGLFVPDSKAADEMKAEPRTNTVDLDKIKTEIRKRFMRTRKKPFTSNNKIYEVIGGNRNVVMRAIAEMFESEELTQDATNKPIMYSPLSQDDDE